MKECQDRVNCLLIENKQRGGLIKPIVDIVAIVQVANATFDHASEKHSTRNFGDDIISEILINKKNNLLEALDHNNLHKIKIMKKVIGKFIAAKGKHECQTENVESACLTRQKNTKTTLFNHE